MSTKAMRMLVFLVRVIDELANIKNTNADVGRYKIVDPQALKSRIITPVVFATKNIALLVSSFDNKRSKQQRRSRRSATFDFHQPHPR
jgi:hypothetical protein